MSTPVRPHDDFLVFGAPVIGEAEIDEVVDSLRSGWLGTGPKVARFEEDFRQYKSAEFAVAVGSCTAALHLSMLAVGLAPGDEVITTPMTFCATVNAIIHAGATPVLADVDPVSMNIDPTAIEAAITERTRAVLIVHFAGRSCDMDGICQLCQRHSLTLIEDCAHAIETTWHGQPAGTFGELGCFSFYVTKNVCTGEGGMILTANEVYASRLKTLALHGMTKDAWKRFSDEGYRHYYVAEAGFKYNMMDIQAALGIHQLKRIEENWQRRQLIWTRYQEELADLPVTRPAAVEADTRHACHLYTLLIDEAAAGISRDAFLDGMTAENIGIGVHYLSILEHPYYQERFSWHPEACPVARRIGRQTASLPLSAALSDADVDDVITATRKVLGAG